MVQFSLHVSFIPQNATCTKPEQTRKNPLIDSSAEFLCSIAGGSLIKRTLTFYNTCMLCFFDWSLRHAWYCSVSPAIYAFSARRCQCQISPSLESAAGLCDGLHRGTSLASSSAITSHWKAKPWMEKAMTATWRFHVLRFLLRQSERCHQLIFTGENQRSETGRSEQVKQASKCVHVQELEIKAWFKRLVCPFDKKSSQTLLHQA